jgi:lipid-A-disaccharide synthase
LKIYLITGEPSGDLLASSLMKALRSKVPDAQFYGVGGETMTAAGFTSLFDISDLAVMGFFEVAPRLLRILKLMQRVIDDVEKIRPDVIVSVDSWGFVSTLLGRLKRRRIDIPKIHYVAPQVWAWKKGRAKKAAAMLDCLMTLLPYEAKYFEKHGLQCDFVGHPVVENTLGFTPSDDFRRRNGIPLDADIISVLPGSRRSETSKLTPIFKQAIQLLAEKHKKLFVLIPTVNTVADEVKKRFADLDLPYAIVQGRHERYEAFVASKAAMAASGTVSLELAAFGTPHVIAYTFNAFTNFLADILVNVKYANLVNILADKEIIPEFTLADCRADLIAAKVSELLDDKACAERQTKTAQQVLQNLRPPNMLPSEKAAETVLRMAERDSRFQEPRAKTLRSQ